MPAHLMDDGQHKARTGRDLFSDFAAVAERSGVYTAEDYADIMEHLIKRWEINSMTGLSASDGGARIFDEATRSYS